MRDISHFRFIIGECDHVITLVRFKLWLFFSCRKNFKLNENDDVKKKTITHSGGRAAQSRSEGVRRWKKEFHLNKLPKKISNTIEWDCDMASVERLFSQTFVVRFKSSPSLEDRRSAVNISVELHSSSSSRRELKIQLTDDDDLFFLYSLTLGEYIPELRMFLHRNALPYFLQIYLMMVRFGFRWMTHCTGRDQITGFASLVFGSKAPLKGASHRKRWSFLFTFFIWC